MASPYTPHQQQEITRRLRYLAAELGLRQGQLAQRLNIDPTNLSKVLSQRIPLSENLVNSAVVKVGVRKAWLVDGDGPIFSNDTAADGRNMAKDGGTPVYDIDVCAGCTELSMMFTEDRIIGYVSLPSLSPDASIVRVSGDSMEPVIANGGYVAVRPISDPRNIFWGQIYVIIMDDYRLVKFLRRNPDNDDRVVLRSANREYDDMDVDRADIRRLFLVEAVLNCSVRC